MTNRWFLLAVALLLPLTAGFAQQRGPQLSDQGKAISDQIRKLRSLPDGEWTKSVSQLAGQIHALPAGTDKLALIQSFLNLVTEGDAGREALQDVADTIVEVLPSAKFSGFYNTLARFARYEHVTVKLDDPQYREALARLEAEDQARENADFTLTDLQGTKWSLRALRGKVVLVNFWATWCPPCRKEMPDMQALSQRFGSKGLVILAISDEAAEKVKPFIEAQKYTFPVLLDEGRVVNKLFVVEGIPKSFVFGRDGKLVAQAIDRRTMNQFLAMLKQAGLE